MAGQYALNTSISSAKSRIDIEDVLRKYGAEEFGYISSATKEAVMFRISGRTIRIFLPLPDRKDKRFWSTPGGRRRHDETQAFACWEQACRSSWRSLLLVIKAKLEAVSAGITTIEQEFLAHIVLPDGSTFGQWAHPQLETMASSGKMPPLLEAPK
jgi:hypothetical protein